MIVIMGERGELRIVKVDLEEEEELKHTILEELKVAGIKNRKERPFNVVTDPNSKFLFISSYEHEVVQYSSNISVYEWKDEIEKLELKTVFDTRNLQTQKFMCFNFVGIFEGRFFYLMGVEDYGCILTFSYDALNGEIEYLRYLIRDGKSLGILKFGRVGNFDKFRGLSSRNFLIEFEYF